MEYDFGLHHTIGECYETFKSIIESMNFIHTNSPIIVSTNEHCFDVVCAAIRAGEKEEAERLIAKHSVNGSKFYRLKTVELYVGTVKDAISEVKRVEQAVESLRTMRI